VHARGQVQDAILHRFAQLSSLLTYDAKTPLEKPRAVDLLQESLRLLEHARVDLRVARVTSLIRAAAFPQNPARGNLFVMLFVFQTLRSVVRASR